MAALQEYADGLPNICGSESLIEHTVRGAAGRSVYLPESRIRFGRIRAAAAVALHMHQPLIPAGGQELQSARIISNLQYMLEHQSIGHNHSAPLLLWCYKHMGELIPQLIEEGKAPRVMLEYSGTLLHGLRQMQQDDVFDSLKRITYEAAYRPTVEWLGTPWGHAVAPSTPEQDYRLHVKAWQHHFAAIFGLEALERVRGFSPAEMALPNHPDVAYEFVKTLRDCGFTWLLVQEHTVEEPGSGQGPARKHIPHRLLCRNSHGQSASILAIINTHGSDSKLSGQMQPYHEAQGLAAGYIGTVYVPPLVTQIADGENGGVIMSEFPPKYMQVVRESSASDVPLMNCSEYLEHLFAAGVKEADLPVLQPSLQKRIWDRFNPGDGPEKLGLVIADLERQDDRFQMEGGRWTNSSSWVRGHENLLGPMETVSALFYEKIIEPKVPSHEYRYRNALFHLMASQTSCYRYSSQGLWTDYGREICRRLEQILIHDFR